MDAALVARAAATGSTLPPVVGGPVDARVSYALPQSFGVLGGILYVSWLRFRVLPDRVGADERLDRRLETETGAATTFRVIVTRCPLPERTYWRCSTGPVRSHGYTGRHNDGPDHGCMY